MLAADSVVDVFVVVKVQFVVMPTKISMPKVVVYQSFGFLAIIALSWFVELTGLHRLILGDHPYISDFRESTLEMLLVLGVWLLVATHTRRLLNHARYLEGFMRVCAWCHRIGQDDRWVSQEEFFCKSFDTPTTHGICPDCLAQQKQTVGTAPDTAPKSGAKDQSALPPAWGHAAGQQPPHA